MLPIPVTLQPSSAHRPGRPVRRLSVTPSSWAEQSVCASRIQQSWHRSARTARPAPHYSGVVFHGMDHGPSFEAAQSRLLRGSEAPYSTPSARALCIARSFGPRSLLPDRAVQPVCLAGGLHLPPLPTIPFAATPFSIPAVWFFLEN